MSGQPGLGVAPNGAHVGQQVGKRCVLGACLDDRPDDLEERTFQLAFDKKYIPPGVDLRRWMTPVEDEGLLGTCAASALAGAVEYLVLRESRIHADVSRLFIYYNQRLWNDQVRHDAGGSLRDGIRVLHRLGVPHEKMWPYTFDNLAVQPPEAVYRFAFDHRITDYCRVPVDLDTLRGCLAGGIPIAFGTHVWTPFTDLGPDGMVRMPQAGDKGQGRHAMLLVGYCDRAQLFIVRNSWGTQWGNAGYCYLPYRYVANPHWTHTCWAVRTSADVTFEEAEHVQPDLQQYGSPSAAAAAAPPAMPTAESLFGAPAFDVSASAPTAPREAHPAAAVQPASAPSLLSSLGALALGKKSPMQIALEMATHHSRGLVARWTGSEMAGSMVSGVIGNLAPSVQRGQKLDVGVVGEAVMNAALSGGPPGPPPPDAATPAAWAAAGAASGAQPGNASGNDPGVLTSADRTDAILDQLRRPPPAVAIRKHHWDDTYDEQAAIPATAPSPVQGARPAPVAPAAPPPTPAGARPAAHAPPAAAPAAAARPAAAAAAAQPAARRPRRAHQTQLLAIPKIEAAHARRAAPAPPVGAHPGTKKGTQVMATVPDLREVAKPPQKSGAEQLREHWQSLDGASGPLGRVVGGELTLSDRKGLGLLCKNGAIVWHPDRGPIELVGTLFHGWSRCGAEGGPLGYPVASELQVSNGEWTARLARFENGLIIDWVHPGAEDIPPFTLLGGDILYQAWVQAGAERGPAGVPLAVPQELPDRSARVLPCSNGAVTWTRDEGARCQTGDGYRAWCARLAAG